MFFRMVYKSGQIFLPFCHNTRVWQTDGQTYKRTDGRTDRILITIPRLHYMQRGKNWLRRYCILSGGVFYSEPSCIYYTTAGLASLLFHHLLEGMW